MTLALRGDRVREWAERRGLKLKDLHSRMAELDKAQKRAAAIGAARPSEDERELAWSTLSRVLNGRREPSFRVVGLLSEALGVSVGYLLGLTDDPATDLEALPVPEPDVAPLVFGLNAMPVEKRRPVVTILENIVAIALGGTSMDLEDGSPEAQMAGMVGSMSTANRRKLAAFLEGRAQATANSIAV